MSQLNYRNKGLTSIPLPQAVQKNQFGQIIQEEPVTELLLDKNNLTAIDDNIQYYPHLKELWARENEIQHVSPNIKALVNLEVLELHNNQLTVLPAELWQLSKLKTLTLWSNQLTSISEEIANLQQLEVLEVDNNQLTSLPNAIWQLPNLIGLGIGRNLFPEIPSEVWSLTKLTILYLHERNLESLPNEVGNLTALEQLYLHDNKLKELPKEIGNLSNLQTLYLSNNQLTHLPSELQKLTNLKILNLAGNSLPLPEKPDTYTPSQLIAHILQHQNRITPYHLNTHKVYIFQNFSLAHLKERYTKELKITFDAWKLQCIDVEKVNQIDKDTSMVFILVTADVHKNEKLMFDLIKKCQHEGKEFFILLQPQQYITFADANVAKGAVILQQHEALRNNYPDQIIEYENVQQISDIIRDRVEQRTPNVRLQNLTLKNIGHFEELSIDFDERVTCIVGENGMGKTSILRALALSLIGTRHDDGKHTYSRRFVRKVQQLLQQFGLDEQKNILRPNNGSITLAYNIDGTKFNNHIELEYNKDTEEIYYDTNKTSEIVSYDPQQTTDYYLKSLAIGFPQTREAGVHNSNSNKRNTRANVTDIVPMITDQDDDRLNAFVRWIVNLDFLANKKGNELQTELQKTTDAARQQELKKRLGRVKERQIIDKAFEIISQIIGSEVSFKDVLTVDPPDLWVSTYDVPQGIPIELLAQGFKELMGWVGYLVQRMAEAYPLYNNFIEQHAVVLIDEIDAFCHPKWQAHLLGELLVAFPKVQFVITSHSPLVVLGRDKGQVIVLKTDQEQMKIKAQPNTVDYWAWEHEDVLNKPFDTHWTQDVINLTELEKHLQEAEAQKDLNKTTYWQDRVNRYQLSREAAGSLTKNEQIKDLEERLLKKEAELDQLIEELSK